MKTKHSLPTTCTCAITQSPTKAKYNIATEFSICVLVVHRLSEQHYTACYVHKESSNGQEHDTVNLNNSRKSRKKIK